MHYLGKRGRHKDTKPNNKIQKDDKERWWIGRLRAGQGRAGTAEKWHLSAVRLERSWGAPGNLSLGVAALSFSRKSHVSAVCWLWWWWPSYMELNPYRGGEIRNLPACYAHAVAISSLPFWAYAPVSEDQSSFGRFSAAVRLYACVSVSCALCPLPKYFEIGQAFVVHIKLTTLSCAWGSQTVSTCEKGSQIILCILVPWLRIKGCCI